MSHEAKPAHEAGSVDPERTAIEAKRKRLRELQDAEAKRQAAREQKALDQELVEAELVEKYSKDGERGVDFDILTTPMGPVVMKRGEWVSYKKFITAKEVNGAPIPEEVVAFAVGNLAYPDRDIFVSICDRFGGVATRCANALVKMHSGRVEASQGK